MDEFDTDCDTLDFDYADNIPDEDEHPGYYEDDGQPSDLQEQEDFERADEYFGMFDGE